MRIKNALALILLLFLLVWTTGCNKKTHALKVGQTLPDVVLQDGNGADVHLHDLLKNKLGIVLFWQTGCVFCKRELPRLEPLYNTFRGSGVVIVGIHVGPAAGDVKQTVVANKLTFPMLDDPSSSTRKLYGILGVPSIFVVKKDGTVSDKILGGLPAEDLQELIKEKL